MAFDGEWYDANVNFVKLSQLSHLLDDEMASPFAIVVRADAVGVGVTPPPRLACRPFVCAAELLMLSGLRGVVTAARTLLTLRDI